MSYRRKLIILILSIGICFGIMAIYEKIVIHHDFEEILILKQEVKRGEMLNPEMFRKVRIEKGNESEDMNFVKMDQLKGVVANFDMKKGNILLKENILSLQVYNKAEEGYEIISIPIRNSDDIASYQVRKYQRISLYYTGKTNLASNLLKELPLESVNSNQNSKLEEGYTTVKLLENIAIMDIYDQYGNVITSNQIENGKSEKMDTIMIEVKKDMALKINNLKQYGNFSIAIIQ